MLNQISLHDATYQVRASINPGYVVSQLLCELQLALLEKQLKPDSPKVADILSQDSPDLDQSRERNLRNWVLMREYKAYIAHVHAVIRKLRESSAGGR